MRNLSTALSLQLLGVQTATKRKAFLAGRKRIREYAAAKAALGSRPAAARACIASTVVGATSTGENVIGALSGECRSLFGRSFLKLYRDVGEIAGQFRAISEQNDRVSTVMALTMQLLHI